MNGVDVLIANTGDGRIQYYWEWNGWWYTLETPGTDEDDISSALAIVDVMTR